MAPPSEIAIEHAVGFAPAAFRLTRRDGKSLEAVVIASPYEFEVGGKAGTSLMKELRWYLEIHKKQGYPSATAATYHQLGMVAEEERDFPAAREWYRKSLEMSEEHGNLHGTAMSYHQLGIIAQEERDFEAAREWYLKSLSIKEREGNLHGAAISYYQLGTVAQGERDFAVARKCYQKALEIDEKQANLHGAAFAHCQLRILAGLEGDTMLCAGWLIRSIRSFRQASDSHSAQRSLQNFLTCYQQASSEDKQKMEAIWDEAGLGPFPPPQAEL